METSNNVRLKDYLNTYLSELYTLKQKQQKLDKLKSKEDLSAVNYDQEKVAPTNKINDPMKYKDEYLDLSEELESDKKQLQKKYNHILKQINKLEDTNQRKILYYFYLKNISIYEISTMLKLSIPKLKKIREEAINNLSDVFYYNFC